MSGQAVAGWFGPSTYDECVIEKSKGILTVAAQSAVLRACTAQFPPPPSGVKPPPLPNDPTDADIYTYKQSRDACLQASRVRETEIARRHAGGWPSPSDCGSKTPLPPSEKQRYINACQTGAKTPNPSVFCRCLADEMEKEFGLEEWAAANSVKEKDVMAAFERQAQPASPPSAASFTGRPPTTEELKRYLDALPPIGEAATAAAVARILSSCNK